MRVNIGAAQSYSKKSRSKGDKIAMVETSFVLFNRGLGDMVGREMKVQFDPKYIKDVNSVAIVKSKDLKKDSKIEIDFQSTFQGIYNFTLPVVGGREEQILAITFRGLEPINYKELKSQNLI